MHDRRLQVGVSFDRMGLVMLGAPADRLVRTDALHLRGSLPELKPMPRTPGEPLEALQVENLTYRHPQSARA